MGFEILDNLAYAQQIFRFEVPLWDLKLRPVVAKRTTWEGFWSTPMGFEINYIHRGKGVPP